MKKVDLSVSQRDKNLLIILSAVVIGFLCYYFIISPTLDAGAVLKIQAAAARAEYVRVNTLVENLSDLETQESDKKQEISAKYETFFYELNQERILYHLDTLIQQSGLPVISYTPGDMVVASIVNESSASTFISYPLYDYASKSNLLLDESVNNVPTEPTAGTTSGSDSTASTDAAATTTGQNVVPTCEVTLNYTSASYASVVNFLIQLEGMNKTIIIKKVDIHQTDATLSGQIVLTLYSMPKVDETESEYLNFLPTVGTGKPDPFH